MRKIVVNKVLELVPLERTDAPDIFQAIDSQRDYLGKWLPFVKQTKKFEDTFFFVRTSIDAAEEFSDYTFVLTYEGCFAGLIGLKDTDKENRKTEIGYWICEEFQGKGLMTQSARVLCEMAFKELDINRIQIKCAVGNIRSNKIPVRLGFTLEGVERDGELMSDGKFTDLNIYGLLKKEKGILNELV